MNSVIFEDCYNSYKNDFGDGRTWNDLAVLYGYPSGENLRSAIKRERKRRGLPSKYDLSQPEVSQKIEYKSPRIGILDLESLPMILYSWDIFQPNSSEQVISEVCLLSWAGKYLNESEIFSDILTSKEAPEKLDERIVKSCWKFMQTCDVLVGHNFQGFDQKLINTRFLKYGLSPLKFVIIDTFLIAKQNFRFSSNKMKFINEQLGIRNKIDNDGFKLWRACHEGKQEALDTMLDYNIGDVHASESLMYRLRPYIHNFNIALYNEINDYQCPVCGSLKLKSNGFYFTSAGKWESVICEDCNCVSRKKDNLLDKDKRKHLLVNS